MADIAVIGCGAWATTAAKLIAENHHAVRLWCHRSEYETAINSTHENPFALPGITLPNSIHATTSLNHALQQCEAVVYGLASPYSDTLNEMAGYYTPKTPILSLCKGLTQTGAGMSTLINTILAPQDGAAILSGPNLAKEIALQKPAATVIAHQNSDILRLFRSLFHRPYFRIYTSHDVVGVELGGIVKNIMAIGTGIIDGLELGENAKAAFITRALKEIKQLGHRFGANAQTFNGLSGLGDLIATCSSTQSRNWKAGHAIATTGGLPDSGSAVTEGVRTAQRLMTLLGESIRDYPICHTIYQILFDSKHPNQAISDLMNRDLKHE